MPVPISIAFLGGLGEIGRNCMVLEQEDRLLLIDCGLMFPDADMHGIDLVLPDFTYLRDNADRIVGCVATHGHEDHVGALSFLLRELSFPIYGSALTSAAIGRQAWSCARDSAARGRCRSARRASGATGNDNLPTDMTPEESMACANPDTRVEPGSAA
jgi:mRNA degradation ribonuclease J1/J2